MTDNTQEIEEILAWLDARMPQPKTMNEATARVAMLQGTKQAIIDWHDKQVENYKGIIKMADKYTFDTGEVYYSQKAVNKQIEAVLDRLEDEKRYTNDTTFLQYDLVVVPLSAIEAERNRLKETK